MTRRRVAAGICGLACALGLARKGFHSLLLEQAAEFGEIGIGRLAVVIGRVHAACLVCSAFVHACRMGARRDSAPVCSAAIARGVPMRARQRATA